MEILQAKFKNYTELLETKRKLEFLVQKKKNNENFKIYIDQRNIEEAGKLHRSIDNKELLAKYDTFLLCEIEKNIKFGNIEKLQYIVDNLSSKSVNHKITGKIFAFVYKNVKNLPLNSYMTKMKDFNTRFANLDGFTSFFDKITDEKINDFMMTKQTEKSVLIDKWLDNAIECKNINIGNFQEFIDAHFDVEKSYLLKCVEEGVYHDNKQEVSHKILQRLSYDATKICKMKSVVQELENKHADL